MLSYKEHNKQYIAVINIKILVHEFLTYSMMKLIFHHKNKCETEVFALICYS